MAVLKQLLKKMYHDYAVMFPGVDMKEVQKASVSLVKGGSIQIPSDYAEFLGLTDGLAWNGLDLFSLSEHDRNGGEFKHTGILQNYQTYLENPLLKKKMVLGTAPEELIVYYGPQNEYQILDKNSYNVIIKLPRFFDVLYFYGSGLME